jgi:hypothetical protein
LDLLLHRNPDSPTGYDMDFTNGECLTTGDLVDVVTQRLYIMLKTFEGEWFLNVQHGVPYERILGQKVRKSMVDMILQDKILQESGVKSIEYFESSLDNPTRVYSCKFKVRVDTGEVSSMISI